MEGFIEVPGGRVWYSRIGEGGVPLLCLHGGPGFCHDYIEALADLADRRPVIFYDQLGCGRSERPDDASLWQIDRFVAEVQAVVDALGLTELHLFGNSWGGMLALQYVLDRRPELVSLTVANSPASIPRFAKEVLELRAELPQEMQDMLTWHEQHGYFACPEYQGAVALWFQRHICRMTPWPHGLERSFAGVGVDCYMEMIGPSDFFITGNLREWDVMGRLGEIAVPTLYVGGRYDEIRPEHVADMHARTPGAQLVVFEDSAHLPFEEERERFMGVMNDFLAAAEGGG